MLSDRLTHYTRKVVDHPTYFAKGVEDSTPGIYIGCIRCACDIYIRVYRVFVYTIVVHVYIKIGIYTYVNVSCNLFRLCIYPALY